MEPENVIVQHLRAIRESIEANTAQIRDLVERVDRNTAQLG